MDDDKTVRWNKMIQTDIDSWSEAITNDLMALHETALQHLRAPVQNNVFIAAY